ncbi:MAG TPA: thioesterase family protein [Longimicrobiales bacterium]|nr:thioesterase family protein [Longimicrobiales bacterium]
MSGADDGWFRTPVSVRFRDLDAMGHAHHTLPLIYLEEARAAFWRELRGSAAVESIDYVMAEITVRFHARIRYPSDVTVGLAVQRVGAKSFTTGFEVRSADGELLSSGSAVQVSYDYGADRSKPIDGHVRSALEAWLARYQNSSAMPADTAPIIPPST